MAEIPGEEVKEEPVSFTDTKSGKRVFMPPGLPPESYRSILQQMRIAEDSSRRAGVEEELKISNVERQLGAPLERTDSGARVEFEDSAVRFDMARSNLVSEKLRKFRDTYPDLEIKTFEEDGDTKLAVRKAGSDKYTLLDSSDMITLSDLAEVGGVVLSPEILTSTLAAIATRGTGLIPRMFGQGIGGFTGRGLDIGIEQIRGYQDDPLKELFTEGVISGGGGVVGEVLFSPVRRLARGAFGRGFMELTPEEETASRTAQEAGIRGLTPGQVNPLARRMESQAAATSKAVQEQRIGQRQDVFDDLTRLREDFGDLSALGHEELEVLAKRIEANIYSLVSDRNVTLETGGRALKKGREEFVRVWNSFVGNRYDTALEAGEDAVFDLRAVQVMAQEFKDGILSKAKPIKDESGRFVTAEPEQLRKLNPELSERIDQILRLNPDVSAFRGNSAFEQIKELRTSFFDLKNAQVYGKEDINNHYAGKLWGALSDVMNNPRGGSEEFTRLLRSANLANTRFERLLEVQDLKNIALQTRPDHLVTSVAVPGNGFVLRTLERIMPEDKFQTFRGSFKTYLLSQPEKIIPTLNDWRPDRVGLRVLLSPQEETMFRKIGQQMETVNSGPVAALLKSDIVSAEISKRLILDGDSVTLGKLISAAGGKESKEGRSLAAGLVQNILDHATEVERGRSVVNPQKLVSIISDLEKRGITEAVLTQEQQRMLKDRKLLMSFLETKADPGASIQAAEIASDLAAIATTPVHPIEGPKKFARGVIHTMRNAFIGRLFTTESGRAFFTGYSKVMSGEVQPDFTTLRALSALAAQAIPRLEKITAWPSMEEQQEIRP